jgi:hypothetical protein
MVKSKHHGKKVWVGHYGWAPAVWHDRYGWVPVNARIRAFARWQARLTNEASESSTKAVEAERRRRQNDANDDQFAKQRTPEAKSKRRQLATKASESSTKQSKAQPRKRQRGSNHDEGLGPQQQHAKQKQARKRKRTKKKKKNKKPKIGTAQNWKSQSPRRFLSGGGIETNRRRH